MSMSSLLTLFIALNSQIPFLPIGQVMCCSLVVTLMSRPSIARELAQDQTTLTLQGNIEKASLAAPNTLAKPVLKRLMRQERKKRPMGDGTGVHMTTTMQQQAFESEQNDLEQGSGTSGDLTPINDAYEPSSKPASMDEPLPRHVRPTASAERPFCTPSLQPRDQPNAGDDSVIENLIGFLQESRIDPSSTSTDKATGASQKTSLPPSRSVKLPPAKPTSKQPARPANAPSNTVHPYVTAVSMDRTDSQQSFGRTPRGRKVPLTEPKQSE